MAALTIVSLVAGSLAASWAPRANITNSRRLEVVGGSLLATGFLLLGMGLQIAFGLRT